MKNQTHGAIVQNGVPSFIESLRFDIGCLWWYVEYAILCNVNCKSNNITGLLPNNHGYVPLVINSSWSFPRSWLITGIVTRLTRLVSLVGQELLTLTEHLSSSPVLSKVRVTRSVVLYVCFVDRCLSFCTFSFGHFVVCSSSIYGFWSTPLVFSNSSFGMWHLCATIHTSVKQYNRLKSVWMVIGVKLNAIPIRPSVDISFLLVTILQEIYKNLKSN